MRGTTVNPLKTMARLARMGCTVLFCAAIAGHFAWPPTRQASADIIPPYTVATMAGAIIGVMIDRLVWRRLNIFGKRT